VEASYSLYKNVSELQGDILFFQNKKEEALEKWKQAKEMGKNSPILELKISTKKYHDPL
jgi:predicted negative regulator of RcsB-dependent stress response